MSGGKVKVRHDPDTGMFGAEYYVENTDATPTIATLPTFESREAAVAHIRAMFPDATLEEERAA